MCVCILSKQPHSFSLQLLSPASDRTCLTESVSVYERDFGGTGCKIDQYFIQADLRSGRRHDGMSRREQEERDWWEVDDREGRLVMGWMAG